MYGTSTSSPAYRDWLAVRIVTTDSASARRSRRFGLGAGKVFSAAYALSLVNPLRPLVQSPGGTVVHTWPQSRRDRVGDRTRSWILSPDLAARVPRGSVVLLDVQEEMLHLAREQLGSRVVPSRNITYVAGDAQACFRSPTESSTRHSLPRCSAKCPTVLLGCGRFAGF